MLCAVICSTQIQAGALILNEYNAVNGSEFLRDGGSDTHFGTRLGNGGDWFELVVTQNNVDLTDYSLEIYTGEGVARVLEKTLNFKNESIWKNLRAGTIITIAEDVPDDISYNPNAGDWWINVMANDNASGVYISSKNFKVNASSWQLNIIDDLGGETLFGEGVGTLTNVNDQEVGKLEENPSNLITSLSNYNDGSSSTFGSPNIFAAGTTAQDFSQLRIPEPTTAGLITLAGLSLLARRK